MSSCTKLLVAAIDFGTTYSGYAFSFKHEHDSDPLKVCSNNWTAGSRSLVSLKTPTCVLFNKDKEFDSFGYEAEDKYSDLAEDEEHQDWFFFKRFKMSLFNKAVGANSNFSVKKPESTYWHGRYFEIPNNRLIPHWVFPWIQGWVQNGNSLAKYVESLSIEQYKSPWKLLLSRQEGVCVQLLWRTHLFLAKCVPILLIGSDQEILKKRVVRAGGWTTFIDYLYLEYSSSSCSYCI